jgi:AcrR family transcriptional regulator
MLGHLRRLRPGPRGETLEREVLDPSLSHELKRRCAESLAPGTPWFACHLILPSLAEHALVDPYLLRGRLAPRKPTLLQTKTQARFPIALAMPPYYSESGEARLGEPGEWVCLLAMAQSTNQHGRAPHQLPPGRHRLGRSFVEANQRQRILDAVADVSSLAGYATMSVEDIISVAGVSRRTFYDTFASKEEAFLAALDGVVRELLGEVGSVYETTNTFPAGVRDCLATFLRFVKEEPQQAELLLIESLAAGPAAIERRTQTLKIFAEMLRECAERLTNGHSPPALTAETIIGGIYEVVYSRLIAGEGDRLMELLPDLAYSIMQPYLGDEEARREAPEQPSIAPTPGTADARA